MKPILTIFLILSTIFTSGQSKAEKELFLFLKRNKLDTFLTVKSGCPNCLVSYEENIRSIDTATIWLVYKKQGQQKIIRFNDISEAESFGNVTTDIFTFATANRHELRMKEKYYQEQKLAKFQAPSLSTFPYEKIQIKIGQFKYNHTLVNREMDDCGTTLTNEDWFKIEVDILKKLDRVKR